MPQFRCERRGTILVLASIMLTACSGLGANPADFSSSAPSRIASGARPWTSTRFDDAPTDFSFAVVTDLESGYRPGVFDVAVAELGLLHPAFTLTVGDMIEGGTEDVAKLEREWTAFDALLQGLHAPFFHVPGNHDLTNLAQRGVWEKRYGRRYYAFVYKNVLFLAIDTEDYPAAKMNAIYEERAKFLDARKKDPAAAAKLPYASLPESRSGEISPEQSAYFEKAIAEHPKVRWTMLLMHKPGYERTDELGLGRIERALQGRAYTVLNGHLHRYAYAERDGRDYVMLGTTGGERAFDGSDGAMDHVMWVRMTKDGPSIANLRLDGVLDKTGHVPAGGERLCLSHGGPLCPAPH